jgi:hypothetical protein
MAKINPTARKKIPKKLKDPLIKPAKDGNTYKSFVEDGQRYMLCRNSVENGKYWKGKLCMEWQKTSNSAVSVLCWRCTATLVPFEEKIVKRSDKPRGWAFMTEYVHKDGTVYHKGVEQPKLKGTLPPTKIEKKKSKKKLSKGQRQARVNELLVEFNKLKKQLQKEKRKTYKAKIKTQMNKVQREIKKVK